MKWLVAGQVMIQAVRFASNLIVARILAPEAFGVMGMVQVVMMAANLFSDIGLRQSVIYHPDSDQSRFLNTVWTLQIVRGFLIWIVCCLVAYPLALYYQLPDLVWLLPITGFSSVVRGFGSTSLLKASRDINVRANTLADLTSSVVGSVATVLMVAVSHSVAALALGWIVSMAAYTICSFRVVDSAAHRLQWDPEVVRSLTGFGRWSMLSGVVVLLYNRSDRLAVAKLLNAAELGSYMIGANLAVMPMMFFGAIQAQILQPAYAKLGDLKQPDSQRKLRRLRLATVAGHFVPLACLAVGGELIVGILYPPQLADAGKYCAMVALAALMRIVTDVGPIFPARGDARTHFRITVVRTLATLVGMACGYQIGLWGGFELTPIRGLLCGLVFSPLLSYAYQAREYHRISAWIPTIDAIGVGLTLALAAYVFGS